MVFRSTSDGGTSKNFLERLATYAVTRVRRKLMPNLLKKTPRAASGEDGTKKRKRGVIVKFNAAVHVKKEKEQEMMVRAVTENDKNELGDSSMSTMTGESMDEYMKKHFDNNGQPIASYDDYMMLKNVMAENSNKKKKASSDTIVDRLPSDDVVAGEVMPLLTPQNSPPSQADDKEDEYHGEVDCGGCTFDFLIMTNPYKDTLKRDYGTKMCCKECKMPLYDALKNGAAHVCVNCKSCKCRIMYCVTCHDKQFQNGPTAKLTTRTSRRVNKQH